MRHPFRQFSNAGFRVVARLCATFVLCCVAGGCALDFADHAVSTTHRPGAVESDEPVSATESPLNDGGCIVGASGECLPNSIQQTGNSLDIAIEGEGFFQLQLPNGELRYTRYGAFRPDDDGQIVSAAGYLLFPQISIPHGGTNVSIGIDGIVCGVQDGDTPVNFGQIQLATFIDPASLTKQGDCLYVAKSEARDSIQGTPGESGFGTLRQGFLEDGPTTDMLVHDLRIKNALNNLANINTIGYRRSRVEFADLVYNTIRQPRTAVSNTQVSPTGWELGNGERVVGTTRQFMQGTLENTQGKLDVAIEGNGFFEVQLPNGESRYTRDGAFRLNGEGQLVNADGYVVSPQIPIPQIPIPNRVTNVSIGIDGTVSGVQDGDVGNPVDLGQIQLATFLNPAGLFSDDGVLFAETVASGGVVVGCGGDPGFGVLRHGFLESSNVWFDTELSSLNSAAQAIRTYIRVEDELLSTTKDIRR